MGAEMNRNRPDSQKTLYPVIDLHCDMLAYLSMVEDAHPDKTEDIGCATQYLEKGNVIIQVMALWTAGEPDSPARAESQCDRLCQLLTDFPQNYTCIDSPKEALFRFTRQNTGIVAAIENASCLCGAEESLDKTFKRLDKITRLAGKPLYISLTHHFENRFGGGGHTKTGLKSDGGELLNHLDGRGIAVDLSHTSDRLAGDILNWIDRNRLEIPVLASHSCFRTVYDCDRNLPDELIQEIVRRRGLIGMNFIRSYVHPDDPSMLLRHIEYGFNSGAEQAVCLGADFYCYRSYGKTDKTPFFPQYSDAGSYQTLLREVASSLGREAALALSYKNALDFMERLY
jgi:microsomal dipeptidase-like Zn-dependent dipeptidase